MSENDFTERKRLFAPVHRRSIEIQQLDALLRIEEILLKQTQSAAMDTLVADSAAELDFNTLVPKAPKGRRK